ncbi:hypothetical protein DAPPUDRAFT_305719 [Daphnia pulex]|uniref:ZP domain-containing protein n=1 Tax=Daphnia pulex TaxID=6669 RepID=E9FXU0_DAPPU|nr:hypothetical protein DAPPUDRAFT_305719 [Daphnia pulex]|eukprot:EFX88231.1 hypothetical protein DAPPUDRAFT_305719 [Daphnia pulex]
MKGRVGFEKLSEMDYRGNTYYTIRNLSLYECQGWCREEPDCASASFSFVVNPLAPIQETVCLLQNETTGSNPTVNPQKAVSTYYMIKLNIRSENVCNRPWTFERVPNKMLRGLDNALIFTATKESCLAACLNEKRFVCRSAEYNYITTKCHLSEHDRRSVEDSIELVDAQGVDYFENLCLKAGDGCRGVRQYAVPSIGVADDRVAHHADVYFYVDKELLASNEAACQRACQVENEFLCRSYLFKESSAGLEYNCQLYHLDHFSLPDGPSTFLTTDRPLLDDGEPVGKFVENVCISNNTGLIGDGSGGISGGDQTGPTESDINCDRTGTCYDVGVHCRDTKIEVLVKTNRPFSGRVYALGRSETCNIDVQNSDSFRLDLTMNGGDCNTQSMSGMFTNTIVLQHHSVVMTKGDKIYKIKCTYDMSPRNVSFGMMPIRDPDMISITSAPAAPPPRIRILDPTGGDVETVRIGDRLIFRIEIPGNTPYGIFARSCLAMAKDSRSTFQIIDDDGCPTDPSIFPRFVPDGTALQSTYEAFRFTESYGVIFQCNVRYCLGPCEPANCQWGRDTMESWGRKRRSAEKVEKTEEDMTMSHEILVLDFGDEDTKFSHRQTATLPANFPNNSTYTVHEETVTVFNSTCPTKTSVLALAVTCALLLLLYICTVFYFLMRRWLGPDKSV